MVSKKILSGDCVMKVLYNEDSEDDLIPESNYNESRGGERTESPEIAMIHDIENEATPIPELKKFWGGLIFVAGIMTNSTLKLCCSEDPVFETQYFRKSGPEQF
jgi:hypothetical protein